MSCRALLRIQLTPLRVFQKLDSQELKLDYGNGKGLTVRFRGFEE